MFKTVLIGKKKYPLSFGLWALKNFEDETGIGTAELVKKLTEKTVSVSIDLFYYGFQDGYRKAKKKGAISRQQIADLFDENPEGMAACFRVFNESQLIPDLSDEKNEVEEVEEKK